MKTPKYYVGIDMSSANFTISAGTRPWRTMTEAFEFENKQEGFGLMLTWLEQHEMQADNTILCMEATGVYGEGLAYFVNAHQYRIAIEPPLKVKRAFMPHGHKNDRVDSQQIAEYSYRFYDELRFWEPREQILEQIKVLLATREQAIHRPKDCSPEYTQSSQTQSCGHTFGRAVTSTEYSADQAKYQADRY